MSNFKVKKITPSIGAEIIGENIFSNLNPSLCNQIYDVLIENKVIFFRNQNLSNDQHIKFAKSFGEIEPPHPVYPHVNNYPEIVLLENDEDRPPPFGFCTIITTTNKNATMTINTKNIENVLMSFYFFLVIAVLL